MDMYARSSAATTSSSSSSAHDQCHEGAEPSCFLVEDLFDFTAVEAIDDGSAHHNYVDIPPFSVADHQYGAAQPHHLHCYDFNDVVDLCVPSDDVAELEWLSHFVGGEDDSSSFYHGSILPSTMSPGSEISTAANGLGDCSTNTRSNLLLAPIPATTKPSRSRRASSTPAVRRCTHCLSEKTPQWRTGPAGPKTLCNACGVRFKSGRLVPEYRPAASPTFVLTQHSNSHRKVMELRRQKEHSLLTRHRHAADQSPVNSPEQRQRQEQLYAQHQFRVC